MGYLVKEVAWSFQITPLPIVPIFIKLLPVALSLGGGGDVSYSSLFLFSALL